MWQIAYATIQSVRVDRPDPPVQRVSNELNNMAAILPEFSVSISQKRWSCVLDPTLALSNFGLPLVMRVGRTIDLWVARELWHILDNTHFYLQEPQRLLQTAVEGEVAVGERPQTIIDALRGWERIRLENDPNRQNCYWIGDGPMESFLPEGQEPDVVWRYEAICADLDRLIPDQGVLASAYRDTVALAVSLPSAFVLTHLPQKSDADDEPDICQVLEQWRIPWQRVPANDAWQKEESDLLRQSLVHAGVGKWVWNGLRLAVLHVTAPAAVTAGSYRAGGLEFIEDDFPEFESAERPADYWRDARAFWYPL